MIFVMVLLGLFFSKAMRKSDYWRATVTPLASIIGSGFLVVAPLLWMMAGFASLTVLFFVLVAAYAIGSIVRFNILYVEPLLSAEQKDKNIVFLNKGSNLILGISYFISIAFYLRILSAFLLKTLYVEDSVTVDLLTTAILLGVGLNGYFKGFDWLETLTEYSVNIKLSIILMLILGLLLHDWINLDFQYSSPNYHVDLSWEVVQKVFGILLIIQGFEISRYIGNKYSPDLRVSTMRLAQIISSLIYFGFVFLIMFLMGSHEIVSETEIINVSRRVSSFLPYALTIGAIFSQFSAAVADTVGCGGTIVEYTNSKISHNLAYLLITFFAIVLIWTFNVFEIISLASRTFAAYYFTQCLHALYINHVNKIKGPLWTFFGAAVAALMLAIMIFGISAES